MKRALHFTLWPVVFFLLIGCAQQERQRASVKYPRKQVESAERKSGPAMLFYQAAEEDADVNNVIVVPPSEKKQEPARQ